jgi:hypothetical protein
VSSHPAACVVTPDTRGSRWKAAIGLLIALFLPFLPLGRRVAPGDAIAASLAREAVWWGYAAVIIVWLLLIVFACSMYGGGTHHVT